MARTYHCPYSVWVAAGAVGPDVGLPPVGLGGGLVGGGTGEPLLLKVEPMGPNLMLEKVTAADAAEDSTSVGRPEVVEQLPR